MLDQAVRDQDNREVMVAEISNVHSAASRATDFTRMNPVEFHGSEVKEDPQKFIDKVHMILKIGRVTPVEKAELAADQLKYVAQVWYSQWNEGRLKDAGPLYWEKLKVAFLDRFFPLEMR